MKLNKYNSFILESIVYDLLLESDLKYLSEFKEILVELCNQDEPVRKIAYFLLGICNKDMKLVQNYIGLDQPDKVSFIPNNKIKPTDEFVTLTGCMMEHDIINLLKIPREGLIFTSTEFPSNKWKVIKSYKGSDAGNDYNRYILHYVQNEKNPEVYCLCVDDIENDTKGFTQAYDIPENLRAGIKVGRFVNKMLDTWFDGEAEKKVPFPMSGSKIKKRSEYTASDVEKFVNAYSAHILFKRNIFDYFEIVSGEDIRYWYLEDNYAQDLGDLGNSCMRHERCQTYFDIYVQNTETCQLLIFKNNTREKILGRALLWTAIDGKKYIDRIYCTKNNYENVFRQWADKNDYAELYVNNSPECIVEVKNIDYPKYPYMDSLTYYKFTDADSDESPGGDEKAYIQNKKVERPFFYLQETNGTCARRYI